LRTRRLAVVIALLAVLGTHALVPFAMAQSSVQCTASIVGQQAGTGTITVRKDDELSISGDAKPFSTSQIFLNFLSIKKKIGEATAGADGRWTRTINIKDYAKWGVGLYRINWKSIPVAATGSAAKEATCTADVKVEGNFFGTRVSWVASAALAFGAAGAALTLHSALSIFRGKNAKWELKAAAKVKAEKDEQTGRVRLKVGYAFSQTLLSTLYGLLSGGAGFAALVGTAASPPNITLALTVTVPLTLASALLGQFKLWALKQAAERQVRERLVGAVAIARAAVS